MSTFNFRIGTKIERPPDDIKIKPERLFSIIECHYDDDGTPKGYITSNLLAHWPAIDDLHFTWSKIEIAFTKPVLDLDDWPHEFKAEKNPT